METQALKKYNLLFFYIESLFFIFVLFFYIFSYYSIYFFEFNIELQPVSGYIQYIFFIFVLNFGAGILVWKVFHRRCCNFIKSYLESSENHKLNTMNALKYINFFINSNKYIFFINFIRFLFIFIVNMVIQYFMYDIYFVFLPYSFSFYLIFSGLYLIILQIIYSNFINFIVTKTKFFNISPEYIKYPKIRTNLYIEIFTSFHLITGILVLILFYLISKSILQKNFNSWDNVIQYISYSFRTEEGFPDKIIQTIQMTDLKNKIEIYKNNQLVYPVKSSFNIETIKKENKYSILFIDNGYYLVKKYSYIDFDIFLKILLIDIFKEISIIILIFLIFALPLSLLASFFITFYFGREVLNILIINKIIDFMYHGEFPLPYKGIVPNNVIGISILKLEQYLKRIYFIIKEITTTHQLLNKIIDNNEELIENTNKKTSSIKKLILEISKKTSQSNKEFEDIKSQILQKIEESRMNMETINKLNQSIEYMNETVQKLYSLYISTKSEAGIGKNLLKELKDMIKQLEENSNKISKVVNFIQDISKQVNLLALNASIEAARAGEAGKGFAVVAEEISKLSNRIDENIKNIKEIVSNNQESSKKGYQNALETTRLFNRVIIDLNTIQDVIEEVIQVKNNLSNENTNVKEIIVNLTNTIITIDTYIKNSYQTNQLFLDFFFQINDYFLELFSIVQELPESSQNIKTQFQKLNEILLFFKLKKDLD